MCNRQIKISTKGRMEPKVIDFLGEFIFLFDEILLWKIRLELG